MSPSVTQNDFLQLEPKSWCQIFVIWATLFLTSLTPNIALAVSDIFSDAYLTVEYHNNMMNASFVALQSDLCASLKNQTPIPLEAYASCLDARDQCHKTYLQLQSDNLQESLISKIVNCSMRCNFVKAQAQKIDKTVADFINI